MRAGYQRLQTHTQNMLYVLLFHYNNGCTKAPDCYVIRTLTVFLMLDVLTALLSMVKHHCFKKMSGVEIAQSLIRSALDRRVPGFGRCNPWKIRPGGHWTGGWVHSRACRDHVVKRTAGDRVI